MKNVTVKTAGYSYDIGDIEPYSIQSVRVKCNADSGVELDYWESSGQARKLGIETYFERNYHGTIEADIKTGKVVGVKNDLTYGPF